MTTQYTPILKLALPVQGELSGTWGDVVNDNITSMIEQAIAGRLVINTWSSNSHTLTTANGTTAEARAAMLSLTDSNTQLGAAGTVVCPALSKTYIVKNGAGQIITVKTASGSGIAIPNGKTMLVYCDGTNVLEGVDHVVTLSAGTLTITGLTTFASLKGADATTVTGILDEDNMNSNSNVKLATQQSIKAYVDSQVGTVDTLAEILANGNTTGGADIVASTDDKVQFRDAAIYINSGADGHLDVVADTEVQIVTSTLNVDAAVDLSSTLVLAGNADFNGDLDVDGVTNLDVVDIDGAVNMATTLLVTGNVDFNGDLDVDGTTNLDVVDIDGALTQDGGAVFNEASADVDFRVESDNLSHAFFVQGSNGSATFAHTAPVTSVNNTADGVTFGTSYTWTHVSDAGGSYVQRQNDGNFLSFYKGTVFAGSVGASGSNLEIHSKTSDGDLVFKGNDGGSTITALTLDMSAAGAATFNSSVNGGVASFTTVGAGTSTNLYSGVDFYTGSTSEGQAGLGIYNATNGIGYVLFGDGSGADAYRGQIGYYHATDSMAFGINGTANVLDITPAEIVMNQSSQDIDFRVESNGNANMLFVDGGNNKVGIGTGTPAYPLVVSNSGAEGLEFIVGSTNFVQSYNRSTSAYVPLKIDALSISMQSMSSGVVVNEAGLDQDFRVESDGNANMLFVDGGTNHVGIGQIPSNAYLHINGNFEQDYALKFNNTQGNGTAEWGFRSHGTNGESLAFYDVTNNEQYMTFSNSGTQGVIFNEDSLDQDFRVESNGNTHMLFVDAGVDRIGIGTSSPDHSLDVDFPFTGATVDCRVSNSDNSNSASGSRILSMVGGSSSGDPRLVVGVTGVQEYCLGIDNSDGDTLKLNNGSSPSGGVNFMSVVGNNSIVFNDGSADMDFRVESDTNTHALFVDAGNSRVGINQSAPKGDFHVSGGNENLIFIDGTTSVANSPTTLFSITLPGTANAVSVSLTVHGVSPGVAWFSFKQDFVAANNGSLNTAVGAAITSGGGARTMTLNVSSTTLNVQFNHSSATAASMNWSAVIQGTPGTIS